MLFHFDAKFRYYVVGVHTSPEESAICHYFYAPYTGALNSFCLSRKTIPYRYPGVRPMGKQVISA